METKVPGKRESRKNVAIRKVLKGEMEVLLWCGIEAFLGRGVESCAREELMSWGGAGGSEGRWRRGCGLHLHLVLSSTPLLYSTYYLQFER
jgi:hypothetical protein